MAPLRRSPKQFVPSEGRGFCASLSQVYYLAGAGGSSTAAAARVAGGCHRWGSERCLRSSDARGIGPGMMGAKSAPVDRFPGVD